MSDSQIIDTFAEITKRLNREDVRPIIYGSLGLYLVLNTRDSINDIDFIINNPADFLTCRKVLLKNGFRIDPDHERELISENVCVSFIDQKDIEGLIKQPLRLQASSLNGADLFNIPAEQHLEIYKIGLKDKYRKEKKETNDLEKIGKIENYLNKTL